MSRAIKTTYTLAALTFLLGVTLPLITVSKFVIISNTYSLLSGVFQLLHQGLYPLFVVVFMFSLVLPIGKMYYLGKLIFGKSEGTSAQEIVGLMHKYGRWAMLDVMIVAVLVVAGKLGALASVEIHLGLYLFGLSVILTMLATHIVQSRLELNIVDGQRTHRPTI